MLELAEEIAREFKTDPRADVILVSVPISAMDGVRLAGALDMPDGVVIDIASSRRGRSMLCCAIAGER